MISQSSRRDLVIRYITESAVESRTGWILFDSGAAGIYFVSGRPHHAFVHDVNGTFEGNVALVHIVITIVTSPGAVAWGSSETIPKASLSSTSNELLEAIERVEPSLRYEADDQHDGGQAAPRWTTPDLAAALAVIVLVLVLDPVLRRLPTAIGLRGAIANVASTVQFYAITTGPVCWIALRRGHAEWRQLGLSVPTMDWLIYVAPIAALILGASGIVLSVESHLLTGASDQCQSVRSAYTGSLIVGLICVGFIAPPCEEFIFRGFIFGWMRLRANLPSATLLSAVLFGLVHVPAYGPAAVLPLVLVGAILSLVYHYSGSLVPGILIHSLFNAYGAYEILQAHGC